MLRRSRAHDAARHHIRVPKVSEEPLPLREKKTVIFAKDDTAVRRRRWVQTAGREGTVTTAIGPEVTYFSTTFGPF